MIKLELDEQQAWFLTQLCGEALRGLFEREIFKTEDEDGNYTYDEDFRSHILEIETKLDKARGF